MRLDEIPSCFFPLPTLLLQASTCEDEDPPPVSEWALSTRAGECDALLPQESSLRLHFMPDGLHSIVNRYCMVEFELSYSFNSQSMNVSLFLSFCLSPFWLVLLRAVLPQPDILC